MIRPIFVCPDETQFSTSATRFIPFEYALGNSTPVVTYTTAAAVAQPVSIAGTVKNLTVFMDGTPGTGKSMAYTLFKNGVATALTVTISNAVQNAQDTTNSVSVSAGDLLCWQVVPTGTPTQGYTAISCTLEGNTAAQTSYSGWSVSPSTTTTYYYHPSSCNVSGYTTESLISAVMPTAGTISNLYAACVTAPGVGKTWTWTLFKNGVAQSVTAAITGSATTANDTSNSVSYAVGDTISISVAPTGTPTATNFGWSLQFSPTVDGESPIFNSTAQTPSATALTYVGLSGVGQFIVPAGESNELMVAPIAFTLKNAYVVIPAPGVGKSFTIETRSTTNPAVTPTTKNISVVISGTSTSGTDTTHTDSVTANTEWAWQYTPSGTPSNPSTGYKTSVVAYIAPTTAVNSAFLSFM